MILRPQEPPAATSHSYVPAWPVVERLQRESYDRCWMITQPSHAALAGEIASALTGPGFPKLEPTLIRAIALHDAGWGPADADAVTRSRAPKPVAPRSFLAMEVAEILEAWTQSIQIAQSVGPAGGYMVSRHFHRIAERRIAAAEDTPADRQKLDQFLAHETQRQKRLAAKQELSAEELESLTDVLQLCDLLSLYFCCGAREHVEFPECCGVKLRARPEAEGYKLDPPVLESGTQFRVAALRFPWSKEKSSEELRITLL
jgi:Protein of unknown function (DUF3891)